MKDIFLEFLSKTLNMDTEELSALLYESGENGESVLKSDALSELLSLDADRVQKLSKESPDPQALRDQYKRGQREAMEELEKTLRKKTGSKSEKKGADLVMDIIAEGIQLDEEKIKASSVYRALEDKLSTAEAEIAEKYEQKISELETAYRRRDTMAIIDELAEASLEKMKVDKSQPNYAACKRYLLKELEAYDYELDEDGKRIRTILKDGKRVENAQKYAKTFDDVLKDHALPLFVFKAQSAAGNGGNKGGKVEGEDDRQKVKRWATEDDFNNELLKAPATERAKLVAEYDKQKAEEAAGA